MSWGVAWGVNHPQATGDVNELPVGENFSYLKRRIVPIWYPSENSPRGCRSIARGEGAGPHECGVRCVHCSAFETGGGDHFGRPAEVIIMGVGEHNAPDIIGVFANYRKAADNRSGGHFKAAINEGYRAVRLIENKCIDEITQGANSIDTGSQGHDGVGHATSL